MDIPELGRLTEPGNDPLTAPQGEPTVAYIGRDVPREVLAAAGFTPVRLGGRPGQSALADRYCGPGIDAVARTQLDQILTGRLARCAGLVISGDCEGSVRLFRYLREIQRLEPVPGVPPFTFLDQSHLPYRTSTAYNLTRLDQLIETLATWAGRPVTAERIGEQIRLGNEIRALGDRLHHLRTDPGGPRLTGLQALRILRTGFQLPPERYRDLLAGSLTRAGGSARHEGVRVFLTGSSHDHDEAYRLIEDHGAVIIGEDHDWGSPALETPVAESGDERAALVAAYARGAPTSTGFGIAERAAYTAARAAEADAQVVICWLREDDHAPAWDIPAQRTALAATGIPLVTLAPQPYDRPDATVGASAAAGIAAALGTGARP